MSKKMKVLITGGDAFSRLRMRAFLEGSAHRGTVAFEYEEENTLLGVDVSSFIIDNVPADILEKPIKQPPNFVRFQNNFKRRGKR